MIKKIVFSLSILASTHCISENLGAYGHTFPIAEQSAIELIQQRLQVMKDNGELDRFEKEAKRVVKEKLIRPEPISYLTTTTNPKIFYFTPTITLQADIKDAEGNVIYPRGTTVNPMDASTYPANLKKYGITAPKYTRKLVFFNGDDAKQVEFVTDLTYENPLKYKLIMIDGNIKNISQQLQQRIYFDQAAMISRRFNLRHVPVVVEQDDIRWKITEYDVLNNTTATEVQNG
jgi:conjugal transfer pilus assembly protein TraW